MSVISMKQLLEAGVHFGHQTRRWNPKMREYIFTERNGIYIIDLQKTVKKIDEAYAFVRDIAANDGTVLFVGTKKQAQESIEQEAKRCEMFYVNQRWLGGLLTNFKTIQTRIAKLNQINKMEADGDFDLLPKKEVVQLCALREKLMKNLSGIKDMKKLPDALFVVDPLEEHNAVAEARKLGIPVFALIDTNADPRTVDYPIPANDDAVRSIKLLVSLIADAVCEGKNLPIENIAEDADVEDITMKDVIRKVEEDAAEYERKKKQRYEEKRAQMAQRRNYNGERRVFKRNDHANNAKVKAEEGEAVKAETKTTEAE